MASDVTRLIDMIVEKIESAKSPAFKNSQCVLERDEILDLLDELRAAVPAELKRAQELLAARDQYIQKARDEANEIIRKAELEAKTKVSQSEVIYASKEKARQIIAQAEDRSSQLCKAANEYAEDVMIRTMEAISAGYNEVKQAHSQFKSVSAAKLQEQRQAMNTPAAEEE